MATALRCSTSGVKICEGHSVLTHYQLVDSMDWDVLHTVSRCFKHVRTCSMTSSRKRHGNTWKYMESILSEPPWGHVMAHVQVRRVPSHVGRRPRWRHGTSVLSDWMVDTAAKPGKRVWGKTVLETIDSPWFTSKIEVVVLSTFPFNWLCGHFDFRTLQNVDEFSSINSKRCPSPMPSHGDACIAVLAVLMVAEIRSIQRYQW